MKKRLLSIFITAGLLATTSHVSAERGKYGFHNNKDRTTSEERLAEKTEAFTAADTDSNDNLSLAEFQAMHDTRIAERIAETITELDTDSSTTISQEEFTAQASEYASTYFGNAFTLADSDGDGVLSSAEFTSLMTPANKSVVWKFARKDSDANQSITLEEFTASRRGHRWDKDESSEDDSDDESSETEATETEATEATNSTTSGRFGFIRNNRRNGQ